MALQGTLDTFALPDVLRLLASTKKTGRLRVSGNRGTGSVWVDDGSVVASDASGLPETTTAVDVLFELLRYGDGSFTFEADTKPASPTAATDVEPLLIEAEHQLIEWREIEAVVPSMEARVVLAPDLPRPEVIVERDRWRSIVAIGGGATVSSIGHTLGLGEVAVCRVVKELVELGLGEISTVPEPTLAVRPAEAPADPVAVPPTAAGEAAIDLDRLASNGNSGTNGSTENGEAAAAPFDIQIPGVDDQPASPAVVEAPTAPALAAVAPTAAPATDPQEADEVARQLASLSPKAARAVAAAARAATDEEREAALAEVTGDDDEPINRGLLLKFLSSVRT